MTNRQIAAIIARRKTTANKSPTPNNMLAACIAAAGFAEHHAH